VPKIRFAPDERILAELSPTRRSTVMPLVELVLLTGIAWLGIGLLDAHLAHIAETTLGYVPENITRVPELVADGGATATLWGRRLLLLAWLWLAWRRCGRFLLYRQRSRMILTDRRLITATGHLRSRIGEIPLDQIGDVTRRGTTVDVWPRGGGRPLRLTDVPFAARFTRMVSDRIVPYARPVY
jgi:hypothetical protein